MRLTATFYRQCQSVQLYQGTAENGTARWANAPDGTMIAYDEIVAEAGGSYF
jgi:hypothetical protein